MGHVCVFCDVDSEGLIRRWSKKKKTNDMSIDVCVGVEDVDILCWFLCTFV